MFERKHRLTSLILTLALAAANLVALNYLVAGWSTARVDLTDEGLYSISPATRRILTGLDEELTVYGYFSRRTHPKLAPLVPQIVDLLDEYEAVSRGKVRLAIIDPGEDEAAEEEAADRFGVRSTPFRLASKYEAAIVNAYFAVVVRYGDQYVRYGFPDLIQVDPTSDGDIDVRLRNLEYDLTRAIKKVVYGFRTTNELFGRVETPVTLTAIWTPTALPELFAEVPETVRKAAEELEQAGGDKFTFEEIDPAGQEDLADRLYQQFGVQPLSLGLFGGGENFYLYALLEVGGRLEQIPLTEENLSAASVREAVENALRRNTPGFLKTIGLVVPDQPELPPQMRMQFQMPPTPPPEFEEVKQFLGQDYQMREVDLESGDGVPSEIDVLLVLKPRNLSEQAVYHLDQYLMRGGRVIIGAGQYDTNFSPEGLMLAPATTGLDDWLAHFGLTVSQSLVLDDQNQALPIPVTRQTPFGMLRTWELAPYPYLVQVSGAGLMNPDITASLDAVGIYWGSPLVVDAEASKGLQVLPILQSSPRSWTSDDLSAVGRVDYEVPAEGTEPHLLAVALSGKFKSYFAGKPAPGADTDAARPSVSLEESPETRLVLLGNEQFVSDFVARALARVDGSFFVENLRFTQNLIDWVGLDNEMLGIRSRGLVSRRLSPIDDARRATVEGLNYAAPVVILLALGLFLRWRRRQAEPLTGATEKA